MAKGRQYVSAGLSLVLASLLPLLLVTACALPKIVVLEDSLTAEEHNDLGYVYEQKEMYDLARKEYLLAAGKRDDWDIPYFNLGCLAFKNGEYPAAEEFFRKALSRAPDNADAMNNLANALLMQKRRDEARRIMEKALSIEDKEAYRDTVRKIDDIPPSPGAHHPASPIETTVD